MHDELRKARAILSGGVTELGEQPATQTVTLLWVEGDDASEFGDLLGATGELRAGCSGERGEAYRFMPKGRGDWVSLIAKNTTVTVDGKIRVSTKLGNVFVFRAVKK